MKKAILLVMLLASCAFWAQTPTFITVSEGVQEIEIRSKSTGDTYRIKVNLPFGYANGQNNYPVLYALDGNVTFGMVSDIAKLLSFERPNSAQLIVGVSYTSYKDWIGKRGRDFMPNTRSVESVENYLRFITEELMPLINENFRTKSNENTIYGHSSAAVFGFYALFNNPKHFKNYILTSPSLDEDGGYIKAMEQRYSPTHDGLKVNLYTSMGKGEKPEFIKAYRKFMEQLSQSDYQGISIRTDVFDGTHMSTMAPALVKGLEFMSENE